MLLTNVTFVNSSEQTNIAINGKKITAVQKDATNRSNTTIEIDCTGAIALPGLINSHDHLDFNCFSPLGNNTYNNYMEWGRHIHTVYKDQINAVLQIPQTLRTAWGMYKNLLAGVTTVVNHGALLHVENPLLTVYQQTQNLHSVQFQKKWKWHLNNPVRKTLWIHLRY